MMNKYTTIKYGTHFETKEEAVERVFKDLARPSYNPEHPAFWLPHRCTRDFSMCARTDLHVVDNKLYCEETHFKAFFKGEAWEDDDVLNIVEARIVKILNEYNAREEARKKKEAEENAARLEAERKAEQAAKDAEKRAKYYAWKEEAKRLGIPFADLCAMKRAEMEEDMYDDDWDD